MNATRMSAALPVALVAALSATALAQTNDDQPRPLPKPEAGQRYALSPAQAAPQPTPKEAVTRLLAEARGAIAVGDTKRAEQLVLRASQLEVPEAQFTPGEDTPARVAMDLRTQSGRRYDSAIQTAGANLPASADDFNQATPAVHYPELDSTSLQTAAAVVGSGGSPRLAQLPTPPELIRAEPANSSAAVRLAEGEQKLREGDFEAALERFRAADAGRGELDSARQARLDDHLRMLNTPVAASPATPPAGVQLDASMIEEADEDQQVLARSLATAIGQAQIESRELRNTQPRQSLEVLEAVRERIAKEGVSQRYRSQLTRRVDREIAAAKKYINDNRAKIELDEANASVLAEIDRESAAKLKQQQKIAELVDQFNTLLDEQSYAEAEVVAKRLYELAPNDPVSKQVMVNAKMIRRNMFNDDIRNAREEGNWDALSGIDKSSVINVPDGETMVYDPKVWGDLQKRSGSDRRGGRFNDREKQIEQRLGSPVKLQYSDRPLAEVMSSLSRMTGVDIYLDPRGLNQEGVSTDTPVSIDLNGEVQLRSALNLILAPLNLAFTIKNEVLMVTSEALREGDVYTETYYVADLVIPIPNFVPSNNIGLQGLINDALAVTGSGGGGLGAPGPVSFANSAPMPGAGGGNPNAMAQQFAPSGGGLGAAPRPQSVGPGGLGGAASADFDSLIELIQTTVAVDTWAANGGGEGAEIAPFPTNLSLVVSQTQSVHEEIADLLDQLRRLQDLQVTIEVRFIRLSDDFFERIGIDFDMNINDSFLGTDEITQTSAGSFTQEIVAGDIQRSTSGATVGVQAPLVGDLATVTADLDLPFRQGSFNVAQPTIGGFNPSSAATFGFAILSDIEAYFLINAAQGDSRTNVLNAPKVTLFNGQQAFVSDTSQSPFVISVVPVVGEFAAAQQPVIVVLSEGTMMSIQAVVSEDRRYVRLTVVPFFSEIGDIDTFTFDGSTTTDVTASSATTDNDDDGTNEQANNAATNQVVTAGTTVQLPTFQFVSVTTTVSVPDGGTVLLGGIKRLSEGREEFGVPLLSKLPYINRLFRNVGIGRETDSLMMMVTPRIIIQEEEEERLGLLSP